MSYHGFDGNHAKQYGVYEAIVIDHLLRWIRHNKAYGRNEHDGRTWTYNALPAFVQLIPFFTADQARRTLESLLKQGVILKGNYNRSKYDRTLWYAFADESIFGISQIHPAISPDGSGADAGPIPISKPIKEEPIKEGTSRNGFLFTISSDTLPPPLDNEECRVAWDTWQDYKRQSGHKLTEHTAKLQIVKLKEMGADRARSAIMHSIESGYTGLYEPKTNQQQREGPVARSKPKDTATGSWQRQEPLAAGHKGNPEEVKRVCDEFFAKMNRKRKGS